MAKKGSGLTIVQRPNGSWRAQIRKVGFPYESKDFLSHEAADEWGLHRLAEIQQTGRLVNRRPAERVTFAEAIEEYIEKETSKRRSTASRVAEEARLRRFLRAEARLCEHALAYLTPTMFEDWRDRRLTESVSRGSPYKPEAAPPPGRLKKDGTPRSNAAKPKAPAKPIATVSPGTVKREMTVLKRVLDFARKRYHLAVNPLADRDAVERPTVQDERDVRLTAEQWQRLIAECQVARTPWLGPFIELALETGARRSSLLKLRWNDLNLDNGAATLRDTKNSRRPTEIRTIEIGLSPRAVEILRDIPRSLDGRVFPTTAGALSQAFERARERAGLPLFRLHDTRHELASRLVEAGWEIVDVMAQGDWRDPKSLRRYYGARGKHLAGKLAQLPKK